MSPTADLQALRRQIGAQDSALPASSRVVPLGAAEIDAALPGGGLAAGTLHEFLPAEAGAFPAVLGVGLGLLARVLRARQGQVLWVSLARQAFDEGRLYPLGIAALGLDPDRLVQVSVPRAQTMLWALEEGLASPGIAAVIGLLPARERAYDFTASRRLVLRAARHGTTALLLCNRSSLDTATAAETRWSIRAAPSAPRYRTGQYRPGLGPPCWEATLIKCKKGAGGRWLVEWDHETLSFRLAAALADRAPQRPQYAARQRRAAAS